MNRWILRVMMLLVLAGGRVGADEPAKGWEGNVALGLSLTRGNSRTFLVNGSVAAAKLMKRDEWRTGADIAFGQQEINGTDKTTAQAAHGFGDWKHLFTDRFYSDLRLDAFHDRVADIDYRVIVGPAAGYYFVKTPQTRLSGELGASYVTERKGGMTHDYATLRLTERGEHSFNPRWKIWEQVDCLPQVDRFENFLLLAELGTEVALNARLSLRVVMRDQYNNRPAAGRDGNDLTLITALAYKF